MFVKFEYSEKGDIVAFIESNVLIVICTGTFDDSISEEEVINALIKDTEEHAHARIAKNIVGFLIKDTVEYSFEAIINSLFNGYYTDLRYMDNPFK